MCFETLIQVKNIFTHDGIVRVKLIQPAVECVASCDVSLLSQWGSDGQVD